MTRALWPSLIAAAIAALTAACASDGGAQPEERGHATPVTRQVYPDSWPVPPLPVMALEHPSGLVWGSPSSYCWRFGEADEPVCEQYSPGSGVNAYPGIVRGKQIHVRIDSETRPDKMFAQVYTRDGNIMVDFLQLGTRYPVLDLDLDPGDYHVRVEGQWQHNETTEYVERRYNTAGYVFGLSVPGTVELVSECSSTLIGGDLSIVLSTLDDRLRTAIDSANGAGCKFNKPTARVLLVLDSDDSITYTETFHIDPPSLTVGFPLPEDTVSESSGGPLPPGDYSRRVSTFTADGEEWQAPGDFFLETVTIAEPADSDDATPVARQTPMRWPESWPVPPLPVMSLEHQSGLIWGFPKSYCWRLEEGADRVCETYASQSGNDAHPEIVPGKEIPIRIDSDTRPDRIFAQVYTRPGNIMVGRPVRTGTWAPVLDLDLSPGDYNVRVIGRWQDNEIAYEFGLSLPGAVELKAGCESTLIGGDLNIVLSSLDDRLRTSNDRANGAGCRFNKPIARVSLTLESSDAGPYTETFHIDPPAHVVQFPLPDTFASEKTGGPLPPGEYSRRLVAITTDGDEWELTSNGSFLETVTIAER